MIKWKVPLFDLDLNEEEHRSVQDVLDSRWLTMGQVTKDFESAFGDYIEVKHALAVNSGTAAMHLAHHAMGVSNGDEVICPSLTFVATANAIRYTGATPVFADIQSYNEPNISPDDVESKITDRTRGIVVVHYAGFPGNMDRIMEIARTHNLYVIEDAAHAVGASYYSSQQNIGERTTVSGEQRKAHGSKLKAESSKAENEQRTTDNGKRPKAISERTTVNGERTTDNRQRTMDNKRVYKVGTLGDIGCFSFFGNKNMTTAEGGMVVTNRDELAEKIRIARSHGMTSLTWERYGGQDFSYDVVGSGFNYRIDELRSSIGLTQLSKLDANNNKRGSLWNLYRERLSGIQEIEVPFSQFGGSSSYHIFAILLSEKIDRKHFMEHLRGQGIQTSIHYPPVHLFSYYRNLVASDTHLPLTEDVGRREVTLPLFPTMTEVQLEYVVNTIKDYLSQRREDRDKQFA